MKVINDSGEMLDQISSPEDLARFVRALRKNLLTSPDEWENPTLERFLESMAAWVHDASAPSSMAHELLIKGPAWRTFAQILLAASAYE